MRFSSKSRIVWINVDFTKIPEQNRDKIKDFMASKWEIQINLIIFTNFRRKIDFQKDGERHVSLCNKEN